MKKAPFKLVAALIPLVFIHPLVIAQDSYPRMPSGKPDFSGNWDVSTLTPLQRPVEFGDRLIATPEEAQALRDRDRVSREAGAAQTLEFSAPEAGGPVGGPDEFGNVRGHNDFWNNRGDDGHIIDGEYRTSVLTYPENGRMPARTPEGQAIADAAPKSAWPDRDGARWLETGDQPYDGPETFPLNNRCIFSRGTTIPIGSSNYNNLKTIVQTDDYLMLYIEWMHWARIIRINDKEHKPAELATLDGDSIAWWEGDTLVVESVNFLNEPQQPADRRIIERFRPHTDGGLVYSYTVEDTDFTDSYAGETAWVRTDEIPYEYACHEGNYSMGNMLRGARLAEAEHRAQKALED